MKRHAVVLLMLVIAGSLTGCLFSLNHPVCSSDGALAVFLNPDGTYSLFPEEGVLHLLCEGGWEPIPAATLSDTGALIAVSPDGTEYLYIELRSGELFDPTTSRIYLVDASLDAIPRLLLETESQVAKAAWTEEGILLLTFGDEELGVLEAVSPETGELRPLFDDLLSFEWIEASDRLILIGGDLEGPVGIGSIGRWDPLLDDGENLGTFVLTEATAEAFQTMPHSFFWDVSPDGTWIALALLDQPLIEPTAEVSVPAIYLIDVEFDTAERVTTGGLIPAFSPDGAWLAYVDTDDGMVGRVLLRDPLTGETTVVPGTNGVESMFWIAPERLGVTFEEEDDRSRLVEIDLASGRSRALIEQPELGP